MGRRGKDTTYGQKGGEGPTRGRKAETLIFTTPIGEFRKRTFFGDRWGVISTTNDGKAPIVGAWKTQADAEKHAESARAFYTGQALRWNPGLTAEVYVVEGIVQEKKNA